ncbi:hydrogenase [Trichlorobacter lovleyi]|uniref:proton-conducting transporter transmembrane domain-containing protein n=1 Tax=Trichlorobacter lovleyi TaxID=313985 RepID=UPI002240B351|nr:proton-conducting transporter membrane subunit [Trichlorobacter lovleyi]QOX79546.1 hydrogenase [Trichlorobacter lovleyi]
MSCAAGGLDPTLLLISAVLLAALSGLPALLKLLSPVAAQRLAVTLISAAALLGLGAAISALLSGRTVAYSVTIPLPFGPHLLGLDPLSALFVIPILLVACSCSIYSLGYWPANQHSRTAGKLTFFFGLLVAALLWVLMARSAGLFLIGWEIMALAAYFVLTTNDDDAEVRSAGSLYLICTHTGTLALFALFSLLAARTGSFLLPQAGSLDGAAPLATAALLVALLGFGLKAGIMPLHIWLPGAHANAPSHISAIMSGVILKIGIYGLIRTLSFFNAVPLWWGITLLALGVISGVVGVAFAIGQHDLKRLLAYHSIENIGIICIGIGVALIGAANGSNLLILLGMGGALLHVINHALFKALLFLGAGSLIHAIGTREIDRMGGLLRRMPWTACFFLIGAVAICGLPPLNGFVSELLIYLGLFNGAMQGSGAAAVALAAPFLALVGGLAVACFVKVFGVVFLGTPRSEQAARAHEAGSSMKLPMALLALACISIGLLPALLAPLLDRAVIAWHPGLAASELRLGVAAPLGWVTLLGLALLLAIALFYRISQRRSSDPASETWGCGYLAPTSRMQYSASSFADILVSLFAGILRPHCHQPEVSGPFPPSTSFASHLPETVLERVYLPFLAWANQKLTPLRHLQHGHLHLYILYTLLTLIALLAIPL